MVRVEEGVLGLEVGGEVGCLLGHGGGRLLIVVGHFHGPVVSNDIGLRALWSGIVNSCSLQVRA